MIVGIVDNNSSLVLARYIPWIPLYSHLHRLRRYYICSPLFPELNLKKTRCKVEKNISAVSSVAVFVSFFRAMFSCCNQPLLSAALEPCVGTVIRPRFVSSFRGMFSSCSSVSWFCRLYVFRHIVTVNCTDLSVNY